MVVVPIADLHAEDTSPFGFSRGFDRSNDLDFLHLLYERKCKTHDPVNYYFLAAHSLYAIAPIAELVPPWTSVPAIMRAPKPHLQIAKMWQALEVVAMANRIIPFATHL